MQSKRILVYRWKAYNYIDILQNLRNMGYMVEEIWQELESYDVDEAFAAKFKEMLKAKTYDFVFTVNYFPLISDACQEVGIPYVSWSCDNPLISMYHQSVFNDVNRIFTFDQTNYYEFKAMGVDHIWYLPLAVDVNRLDYLIEQAKDLSLYSNEIAFVGSLYERNSYDRISPGLSDYLRGYFDAVMLAQSDLYTANIIDSMLTPEILAELETRFDLEKSQGSFSDLGLIFSTTTLGFKIAQLQRRKALIELSKKHKVSIYSNSDTTDLIRVDYRGSVDYWSQMPKVFYSTKINLNFTIPNIKSGIPLRMWDVLGSGGFLLSNFQAETPLYFEDGVDMVSFLNRQDMLEKVDYYLKHEDERAEIARQGREKVRLYHTYPIRLRQMLEKL